jgi:hypothetical protein
MESNLGVVGETKWSSDGVMGFNWVSVVLAIGGFVSLLWKEPPKGWPTSTASPAP